MALISEQAINERIILIDSIRKISGNFSDDYNKLENEIINNIIKNDIGKLISHLRLCGDIPESYSHDSSEEKLYSKYTDLLLCLSFRSLGMTSFVLTERADAADVETFAKGYSFVADAKAFRLSRTAKNQKDFKIQAMDGWKRGKPYAMVVCPIYQLPTRSSQIYQQASARNVCIFTYSHLVLLILYALEEGVESTEELMEKIFKSIPKLNPHKDASYYWSTINGTMLSHSPIILNLWQNEKQAAIESIQIAKNTALDYYTKLRENIVRMSHGDAINALLKSYNIDGKINKIQRINTNNILDLT